MTTVFPEARVKKYIEMRGADAGDRAHLVALPAFWTGLMYDQGALDAAWDLVRGWDAATREGLRVAASVSALRAEVGGVRMARLAAEALAISRAGLVARGLGEEALLAPLEDSVRRGEVQADRWLALWQGDWAGDLRRLYSATAL
jgi:glutamate--cysteine ligase